jgi:CysZ protein
MMNGKFVGGLTFWLAGWKKLLTTKSLFMIALIPILLSFSLFGLTLYLVFTYVGSFVTTLLGYLPAWLTAFMGHWLDIPLTILFGLLLATIITYLLYLLHMIIAIPFYSLLADRTLRARGIPMPKGLSLRVLKASLLKSILFVIFGVVLFALSFAPGLNLVVIAAAMLILAADIMDYSFEAMGFDLAQRLDYLRRNFAQVAGMATALSITLIVPGLALLLTPGAVVGAALKVEAPPPRAHN